MILLVSPFFLYYYVYTYSLCRSLPYTNQLISTLLITSDNQREIEYLFDSQAFFPPWTSDSDFLVSK